MKYFEDIAVGERDELGSHTFGTEEIKAFARRFDPQHFHLDEAAAERSHFGKLCASGWHTASVWMRLLVAHRAREADAARARGEPVGQIGPSPGFDTLKWIRPVFAGDSVTYTTEIVDKRESKSRPGWGLVRMHNTGTNQNGDAVLTFFSTGFVERRPGRPG